MNETCYAFSLPLKKSDLALLCCFCSARYVLGDGLITLESLRPDRNIPKTSGICVFGYMLKL
jgi:hypothetical protein